MDAAGWWSVRLAARRDARGRGRMMEFATAKDARLMNAKIRTVQPKPSGSMAARAMRGKSMPPAGAPAAAMPVAIARRLEK